MIILVYRGMLIVAFVEMAGVHDWGGDLNDSRNTYYACHLKFSGGVDLQEREFEGSSMVLCMRCSH